MSSPAKKRISPSVKRAAIFLSLAAAGALMAPHLRQLLPKHLHTIKLDSGITPPAPRLSHKVLVQNHKPFSRADLVSHFQNLPAPHQITGKGLAATSKRIQSHVRKGATQLNHFVTDDLLHSDAFQKLVHVFERQLVKLKPSSKPRQAAELAGEGFVRHAKHRKRKGRMSAIAKRVGAAVALAALMMAGPTIAQKGARLLKVGSQTPTGRQIGQQVAQFKGWAGGKVPKEVTQAAKDAAKVAKTGARQLGYATSDVLKKASKAVRPKVNLGQRIRNAGAELLDFEV